VVYVSLVVLYVLIHYLFVSQTAQMLALFGIFMGVAIEAGVPPALIALMLLFATNFFSVITPQGSSANVIFAGSGYLTQGEIYRNGGLVTLANLLIFLIIGTPWILLVT
jgi:DASS family divalent anion:Na+ symporter